MPYSGTFLPASISFISVSVLLYKMAEVTVGNSRLSTLVDDTITVHIHWFSGVNFLQLQNSSSSEGIISFFIGCMIVVQK